MERVSAVGPKLRKQKPKAGLTDLHGQKTKEQQVVGWLQYLSQRELPPLQPLLNRLWCT